jgi:hypothetical protein
LILPGYQPRLADAELVTLAVSKPCWAKRAAAGLITVLIRLLAAEPACGPTMCG